MKKIILIIGILMMFSVSVLGQAQGTVNARLDSLFTMTDNFNNTFIYPETYGVVGDGTVNDSADVMQVLDSAKGRVLVLTDALYAIDKVIDYDLDGGKIIIETSKNSQIYSTATISNEVYYTFKYNLNLGIDRPDVGAVYSNNGSQFEVILDTLRTEYILTQKISGTNAPSASGTLTKVTGGEGSLTSYSYTSVTNGQYYIPQGAITFRNGDVEIRGVSFHFYNDGTFVRNTGEYLDGLLLYNCSRVDIDNILVTGAPHMGIRVVNSDWASVTNSYVDSCLFMGIDYTDVAHGLIDNNTVLYIGYDPPDQGYGISVSHEYGTYGDNQSVQISNNKTWYCLRKGIDAHGGMDLKITGNWVKGFAKSGIDVVNSGNFELGHLNYARDILIEGNTVENDSAWYESLNIPYVAYGDGSDPQGIKFGSYQIELGDERTGGTGGNWKIINNTLKNLTTYINDTLTSNYGIHGFGALSSSIQIRGNSMDSSVVHYGVLVGAGNDEVANGQPLIVDIGSNVYTNVTAEGKLLNSGNGRIVLVTAGETININNETITNSSTDSIGTAIEILEDLAGSDIKIGRINNSTIMGSFGIGTKIINADSLFQMNNNSYAGTFELNRCRYWDAGLRGSSEGNIYDYNFSDATGASVKLPDFISVNSGTGLYSIQNSTTGDTVHSLTINALGYLYGSVGIKVDVYATANITPQNAVYELYAYATNEIVGSDTNAIFEIDTLLSTVVNGTESIPTMTWVASDAGYPDIRTLQIYCPEQHTGYLIKTLFNSHRLAPYQRIP